MSLMERLQRTFVDQPSGPRTLLYFGLTFIVWLIFGQYLIPEFVRATHDLYPIDMSFPTTPQVIYEQLQQYSDESVILYRWFFLADLFYPPFAALLWASLWGWLLKFPVVPWAAGMVRRWLWLPFAVCGLDWLENIGFITVIESYPRTLPVVAWLASIIKHLKILIWLGQVVVTVTLLSQLLIHWRRRSGNR